MPSLGPDTATLTVRTGRAGAAARAGHDLLIEVTRWSATLGEDAIELEADPRSLRVRDGTGGITALGDEEKAAIAQTIDDEVLKGRPIAFRSTRVERNGGRVDVEGELELAGVRRPVGFALDLSGDGRITGRAQIRQSDWDIKPYSALFGTLKVADVVDVAFEAEPVRSEKSG